MKLGAMCVEQILERMKSPLALVAGNIPGCVLAGPDHATFDLDGTKVCLVMDGAQCLQFTGDIGRRQVTGKRAFEKVRGHCRSPYVFKYSLGKGCVNLVSEFYLCDSTLTKRLIKHAKDAIKQETGAGLDMPRRPEKALSSATIDEIQEVLEQLPYGFRRTESGWMGSYNSSRFLHRIVAAASAVQGAETLRFEIGGDLLRGDDPRVLDALALFFLDANACTRYARFSLSETAAGTFIPLIETVLPVELLTVRSACAHLAALVTGADHVRAEAAGLASPGVADAYLRFRSGAMRSGRKTAQHD